MIALTTTVTKSVKEDVIAKLEMINCKHVSASPERENTYYEDNATLLNKSFPPLLTLLTI